MYGGARRRPSGVRENAGVGASGSVCSRPVLHEGNCVWSKRQMIRRSIQKLALLLLAIASVGMLAVGALGVYGPSCKWSYRPDGFPLSLPQGWIDIEYGHVAGQWLSLGPGAASSARETRFFNWLDKSFVSKDGVAYRVRLLIIWPIALQCLGAALLAFLVAAFVVGPYRHPFCIKPSPKAIKGDITD